MAETPEMFSVERIKNAIAIGERDTKRCQDCRPVNYMVPHPTGAWVFLQLHDTTCPFYAATYGDLPAHIHRPDGTVEL